MTWLPEETKKMVFLELQGGASVKALMTKYHISRPTVSTIRNSYAMDEAEEGDESEKNESEGSGETLGDSSPRSEESEGSEGSEESEASEASKEGAPVHVLEKGSYLPSYEQEQATVNTPRPTSPDPVSFFRNEEFIPEQRAQPRTPPVSQAPTATAYNITKDQLFICDKIKAYVNAFPHKVGSICGETDEHRERWLAGLRDLPLEKLHEILEGMKYKIQQGGVSDFAFTLVCSTTLAIETGAPYVGLNLKGYSDSIRTNSQAREAILEIMCEHMSDFVISPEKRLILILLTTMYNTHRLNQTVVDQQMKEPAPSVEKFADL